MEIDCDSGVVRHQSKIAEFGAGEQPIYLLTRPVDGACPWVRPKLTDLYDVSVEQLPSNDQSNFEVQAVADNGTVTALDRVSGRSLVQRALGASAWEVVSSALSADDRYFVARDGGSILASLREGSAVSGTTYTPTLLTSDGQTTPLSGFVFDSSIMSAATLDLSSIAGSGRVGEDPRNIPWIWDTESGQRVLAMNDEVTHATPMAVGKEGIVVGTGGSPSIPNTGFFNVPYFFAMRWNIDGVAEVLRDTEGRVLAGAGACGFKCDLIIGNGRLEPDGPIMVNPPSAWYWKSAQDSALLTSFDADTEWAGYTYWAADLSGDGSFVTGSMYFDRDDGGQERDGLLWTQNTGAVGVTALLESMDVMLGWDDVHAVAISSNGKFIAVEGSVGVGPSYARRDASRAAVLRLEPKVDVGAR
jgi:hypothetical protein